MAAGFSARGECIYFPNLKGIGRADYLFVEPTTSKAWVHYNVCPNGAGPIPALPEAPESALDFPVLPDGMRVDLLSDVPECAASDDDLSEACATALIARKQGYLYIHKSCSVSERNVLMHNILEAYAIIRSAKGFPAESHHKDAASYWMGPDWQNEPYLSRITGQCFSPKLLNLF